MGETFVSESGKVYSFNPSRLLAGWYFPVACLYVICPFPGELFYEDSKTGVKWHRLPWLTQNQTKGI